MNMIHYDLVGELSILVSKDIMILRLSIYELYILLYEELTV